jgi:shikimate dehydrogenase
LDGEYRLYPVPPLPEGDGMLKELLAWVRSGEVHGLNVTIPHKLAVLAEMDGLTPVAKAVGAVNTVYLREGRVIGDNTDAGGFWADLQRAISPLDISQPHSALVLGAGGSARAVAYALFIAGWQVYVAARRIEQAHELCASLQAAQGLEAGGSQGSGLEASAGSRAGPENRLKPRVQNSGKLFPIRLDALSISNLQSPISLLINTTPIGMSPHIDASPWPQELPLPRGAAVYDLVYNPLETALLGAARRAGLPAFSGLGMLVEQAALAFERWTGLAAPRDAMRRAVDLFEFPE